MEQIVIIRPDGSLLPLTSKGQTSGVTKAEQIVSLLGEDVVNIGVKTAGPIEFYIGDKINVYGKTYTLNQLPTIKKIGTRNFEYTLNFEGVQYDLIDAQWLLPDETVLDSFTGDLDDFINILIDNANRVFPGTWIKGQTPADTDTKTLTYTESNCLEVLQKVCEEYDTEFEITQNNGIRTINIKKAGVTFPYTFSYGRSGGLYELTRQNIDAKNVVTRLYVYGGSNNLGSKYRYSKLCLPGLSKNTSFIENSAAVEAFGIKENTKTFDKIYPKRVGEVSALGDGVRHFIDNTMNFDLNELEEDGETTKWRINGVKPKIKFSTGGLAGYEFECSYKHETKTITIDPFTDENGMKFPSETSAAFQFKVGDKYIFTDINLPDAYKADAETKLQTDAEAYYLQYCQPQVQYSLGIDQNFIKQFAGELTIVNLFGVGDYIEVEDADIGLAKSIRITGFTRDLLQPYKYAIQLGDSVTKTVLTRVISDLQKIDKIIEINDLSDPSKARRNWRAAQEVLANVFDPEGNYFSEKIKPLSIETSMLAVGAKSMQFVLQNTLIEANYEGNKNTVKVTGGTLAHYTISENTRYWSLTSTSATLTSDAEAYYIYAKCEKGGNAGTIILSTSQIKVNEDPLNYHFWIGVINSVDDGVRAISLTYGATTINGKFIKTGRIESSGGGKTYFDLDSGEIGGKISFVSSTNEVVEMGAYADSVKTDIENTKAEAEAAAQTVAEAEAALAEANAIAAASDLVTAEQERAIQDAIDRLQEAKDHANAIETTLGGLISDVEAKANEKKRVFVATPFTPYDIGDLWVDGEVLRRCVTAKQEGPYVANNWDLAVYYDNTKTVIDGGVVTSGTIQLAGALQNILAGITGEGIASDSVRIWAGASKENRATSPFRVLQDGSIVSTKGTIGGLTIEANRLTTRGERIEINGNDSVIALRDASGNIKTILKPTDIAPIEDYFADAGSFSVNLSPLNGNYIYSTDTVELAITGSAGKVFDLNIPSYTIYNYALIDSQNTYNSFITSIIEVDLLYNGAFVETLQKDERTSYWSEFAPFIDERTFVAPSIVKTVQGNGRWGIRVWHGIRESQGGNGLYTAKSTISNMGVMTASQVVNRSEIGNNGMVIATSNQSYSYEVDNLHQIRKGSMGLRVTPSGIQKSSNMNSATPTWTNI